MTFLKVRNTISKKLEEHLGIPVKLSEQTDSVPEFPFCFYSVTTPYASTGELGNYSTEEIPGTTDITTTREEQPSATFSFVMCSINRHTKDADGNDIEPYIYGEDEAQILAEKAQGFFLHVERDTLSNLGIVVVSVTNVTNRTTLVVDEAARRYGFDVRVRYVRSDERTDGTVKDVLTIHKRSEI